MASKAADFILDHNPQTENITWPAMQQTSNLALFTRLNLWLGRQRNKFQTWTCSPDWHSYSPDWNSGMASNAADFSLGHTHQTVNLAWPAKQQTSDLALLPRLKLWHGQQGSRTRTVTSAILGTCLNNSHKGSFTNIWQDAPLPVIVAAVESLLLNLLMNLCHWICVVDYAIEFVRGSLLLKLLLNLLVDLCH